MENAFDVESLMGMGSTGLPVQKFSWIKTDIGRNVYFSIYKKKENNSQTAGCTIAQY